MRVKKKEIKILLRMIDSNVIIHGTILREDNESDISLDFHVVIGMDRPNVMISFVRIKVGFHLICLKYKKKKKRKKYFMFIKIITNDYIPTNMDTYQHKEIRSILKHLSII